MPAHPATHRRFLASLLLVISCAASCVVGPAGCASHATTDTTQSTLLGAVASDHALAERAGMRMLEQGGNAVDAAVATSLALSVVRPDSCGIGGGGFMVIHLEDHPSLEPGDAARDIAINYRETCPSGIGPTSYEDTDDPLASRVGGMAVGVPGTVAGLLHAHERYGLLDRAAVFAPAIEYAERGWRVDRHHAAVADTVWAKFEDEPGYIRRFPFVGGAMTPGGAIKQGDRLRNPAQAKALRLIAREGNAGFYEGPVAEAIVESVRRDGGVITRDDLRNYRVSETQPIRVELGESFGEGRTMLVMPPPSSGGVAIAQMFGILDRLAESEGFAMPATGYPSPKNARLLIETMKHAFADRSRHLADPAFVDLPLAAMLDAENLDRTARLIASGETLDLDAYGVAPQGRQRTIPTDGGTSHISVVDGFGNAVSCTETINLSFGSLLAVDGFGFCLNNEMDDFTTVRGAANAFGLAQSDDNLPEPGKRPLSSMSPTIVLDAEGRPLAIAGASGGPRIINATAQTLMRMLMADAGALDAVSAPRLHHQWRPDAVLFETALDEAMSEPERNQQVEIFREIEAMGYELRARPDIGACQLIRVRHSASHEEDADAEHDLGRETIEQASDPRKRHD